MPLGKGVGGSSWADKKQLQDKGVRNELHHQPRARVLFDVPYPDVLSAAQKEGWQEPGLESQRHRPAVLRFTWAVRG